MKKRQNRTVVIGVRLRAEEAEAIDRLVARGEAEDRSDFIRRLVLARLLYELPEMARLKQTLKFMVDERVGKAFDDAFAAATAQLPAEIREAIDIRAQDAAEAWAENARDAAGLTAAVAPQRRRRQR